MKQTSEGRRAVPKGQASAEERIKELIILSDNWYYSKGYIKGEIVLKILKEAKEELERNISERKTNPCGHNYDSELGTGCERCALNFAFDMSLEAVNHILGTFKEARDND